MHKLILLVAAAAFLSIAGLAAADTSPTLTAPTTTTVPTPVTSNAGNTTSQSPDRKQGRGHWFAGSVSSVGDSSITVGVLWTGPNDGYLNGQTVTVAVPSNTRISEGPRHKAIALASIQPGDLVSLRARGADASSLTAVKIHVFCNCHWVGGTISSVGTTSFQVSVKRTGPYDGVLANTTITLQVNAETVYLAGPHHRRIAFSDLKVGEGVGVVFAADGFFKAPGFDPTTATFTAKRVHIWGHRQVPPPSTDSSSAAQITS